MDMEGRHSPMLSICLAAQYTLGPSVPVSTSDAGYLDGPRQMSIILDAVFWRDRAYWSSTPTFVCIRPTSRWRCTAAVIASPLESRSTHCLPLSSSIVELLSTQGNVGDSTEGHILRTQRANRLRRSLLQERTLTSQPQPRHHALSIYSPSRCLFW